MTQLPEMLVGRYKFIEKIGAGGFGVVSKFLDVLTDEEVAVKTIPAYYVNTESKRLIRELDILIFLYNAHPHVIGYYNMFVTRVHSCSNNTNSNRNAYNTVYNSNYNANWHSFRENANQSAPTRMEDYQFTQGVHDVPPELNVYGYLYSSLGIDDKIREHQKNLRIMIQGIDRREEFNVHIVMPLMKGDLLQFISLSSSNSILRANQGLTYEALSIISVVFAFQVCFGLDFLHKSHILHRDMKPDNILVRVDAKNVYMSSALIIDLGLARDAQESDTFYICTRYYRPPEMITNSSKGSPAIDVWSLGCIFYEMCTGHILFSLGTALRNGVWDGLKASEQLEEVMKKLGTPSVADVQRYMPEGNAKLYLLRSQKRPCRLRELMLEKWRLKMSNEEKELWINLISQCLAFFPQQRPSAEKLCCHELFRRINIKYNENIIQYKTHPYEPTFKDSALSNKAWMKNKLYILNLTERALLQAIPPEVDEYDNNEISEDDEENINDAIIDPNPLTVLVADNDTDSNTEDDDDDNNKDEEMLIDNEDVMINEDKDSELSMEEFANNTMINEHFNKVRNSAKQNDRQGLLRAASNDTSEFTLMEDVSRVNNIGASNNNKNNNNKNNNNNNVNNNNVDNMWGNAAEREDKIYCTELKRSEEQEQQPLQQPLEKQQQNIFLYHEFSEEPTREKREEQNANLIIRAHETNNQLVTTESYELYNKPYASNYNYNNEQSELQVQQSLPPSSSEQVSRVISNAIEHPEPLNNKTVYKNNNAPAHSLSMPPTSEETNTKMSECNPSGTVNWNYCNYGNNNQTTSENVAQLLSNQSKENFVPCQYDDHHQQQQQSTLTQNTSTPLLYWQNSMIINDDSGNNYNNFDNVEATKQNQSSAQYHDQLHYTAFSPTFTSNNSSECIYNYNGVQGNEKANHTIYNNSQYNQNSNQSKLTDFQECTQYSLYSVNNSDMNNTQIKQDDNSHFYSNDYTSIYGYPIPPSATSAGNVTTPPFPFSYNDDALLWECYEPLSRSAQGVQEAITNILENLTTCRHDAARSDRLRELLRYFNNLQQASGFSYTNISAEPS